MDTNAKKSIRKVIKNKRSNLSDIEVMELSKKVINNIINLPQFKDSKTIMVYLSFGNEIDTFGIIEYMKKMKKHIIVPYTSKEEIKLIPTRLKHMKNSLERNPYGYLEPKKEFLEPVDPKDIDLIIVPGLAFDKVGNRIGYGGGYYDRLLKTTNAIRMAVAYDFQLFSRVPTSKYDVPMNYIVTPTKVIIRDE